ncbi:MAG: hypothetical protein HW416_940 [Chloroflexi bacterium]|nr:hypothetical protein [Chloroflexota bacterium]
MRGILAGGRARFIVVVVAALTIFAGVGLLPQMPVETAIASHDDGFQSEFDIRRRSLTDTGESPYFVLKPGFRIELRGPGERVVITVLDETRMINGIRTRVVEERSFLDGVLHELARNYFVMDRRTLDVFYCGEDVTFFPLLTHEGSWLAVPPNRCGLFMPGDPRRGMKFYNEWAPGVAQDRTEILSTRERVSTRAGRFSDCVLIRETSPIDPDVLGEKTFCPRVGITVDGDLRLWRYGYRERGDD